MHISSTQSFNEHVWELCKRIPQGKVSTYKEIAHALDCRAYRAVGNALHKNPYAPLVPCHRVVKSDGSIGGFAGGCEKKKELLREEGILIEEGKVKEFEQKRIFFHGS